MAQIKFTLKCPQCGGTRFKAASTKPDSITCANCGTSLDLAEEKKRIENEARAAVEEKLRSGS